MQYDMQLTGSVLDTLGIGSNTRESMLKACARRAELSGNTVIFYKEPFTPISLTGTGCSLGCKHCNSHYLHHMLDGSDGKLYSQVCNLAGKGEKGILLSGGSAEDGSVPVYRFGESIEKIKNALKLKVSAHTGIVDEIQAEALGNIDMALVDVIGDDETIHDILGLEACVQDYEDSLRYLSSAGIALAPHIIVGLHNGKLKGEFRALEIAKKFNPEVVVIVVFIPTKGTALEGVSPPGMEDVSSVITKAREMLDVPLSLSCVRPGGRYRSMLDRCAILSGIDRIAVPSGKAYATCRELGLNIIEIPKMCCSYKI